MATNLDPDARAEFLELIKDLCDLVPDRNLNRLETAVRKLLPPDVEAELASRLGGKPKGE
jgi:hypothetical protein